MESSCVIAANPEIAGIGIRVSLYVQTVLVTVPVILVSFAPKSKSGITEKLFEDLSLNIATVLVTGSAMLVSAFVQARLYDFSLYHGLIVLNLSWLNVLTVLMPISVAEMRGASGSGFRIGAVKSAPRNIGFLLYVCAIGAYGIWLAYHMSDFGSYPDCNSSVVWVVFGRSIQATAPGLRTFLLVVSSMAAFPVVNIYLLVLATLLAFFFAMIPLFGIFSLQNCFRRSRHGGREELEHVSTATTSPTQRPVWSAAAARKASTVVAASFSSNNRSLAFAGAVAVAPSIIIIASTEQLIAFNRSHVEDGEDDWTFGQILALLLLTLPLWQVVSRIWTEITGGGDDPSSTSQVDGRDETTAEWASPNALEKGETSADEQVTTSAISLPSPPLIPS
ncbi:hypothetical protein CALCODRAFT_198945 [Calocera cornea HHB12733]|uniref:Uncharacterized protein n=1 Tax=Calocera cornea HHB12733 TaxID=1353952 RepID=A0A165HG56_9BASI|nr:hypothetical protein CALCODRAFT_198945 [Calocera cornea HHB12733]